MIAHSAPTQISPKALYHTQTKSQTSYHGLQGPTGSRFYLLLFTSLVSSYCGSLCSSHTGRLILQANCIPALDTYQSLCLESFSADFLSAWFGSSSCSDLCHFLRIVLDHQLQKDNLNITGNTFIHTYTAFYEVNSFIRCFKQ